MSEDLGRGRRRSKRLNYKNLDSVGRDNSEMAKPKKRKQNKQNKRKGVKKTLENKVGSDHSLSEIEEQVAEPSTSENNQNDLELVDNLHSDMGRGSEESEPDTSDIDSDTLEKQNKELEELDKLIEERRQKRSNKERRERKAKMQEMRKLAEEKRKILQDLESDSDGPSETKKRKVSKSKNGKGVKNSNKGKSTMLLTKNKSTKKSNKKTHKKVRTTKSKNGDQKISESDSSDSENSSEDPFAKAATIAREKREKRRKRMINENNTFSLGKKKKAHRRSVTPESEDTSTDSSSSSDSSYSESSSAIEDNRKERRRRSKKKSKKGKCIKSGVRAKGHKIRLKTSELCAQAVLDEEHCPSSIPLEELTFAQLVAGELEICTMKDVTKKERFSRLNILKLLAYFAAILPQNILIETYKAVILKIEKGLFAWSSQIVEKTENMLDRAVSKYKVQKEPEMIRTERSGDRNNFEKQKDKTRKDPGIQLKSGDKVVYCADYNKNKCDKDNSHEGKFLGREVMKLHICKQCLTIDKEKRFHPEGDEKCPHKSA